MRRSIFILFSIFGLLLALLLLSLLGAGAWVQSDHFRDYLSRKASERLGQPVSLAENMQITPGWSPVLRIHGLKIANPAWASRPNFAEVDSIEVAPRLLPLLRGKIVLDVLSATGGDIWLETGPDGQRNWPGRAGRNNKDAAPRFFTLTSIVQASIRNFRIGKPGDDGELLVVENLGNRAGEPDTARFAGSFEGRPLQLAWSSENGPWPLSADNKRKFDFSADVDGNAFSGHLVLDTSASPPQLNGDVQAGAISFRNDDSDDSDDGPIPLHSLHTAWLKLMDSDIRWRVQQLQAGGLLIQNLRAHSRVVDGKLTLDPLAGEIGKGSLQMRAALSRPGKLASLRLSGELENIDLSERFKSFASEASDKGKLDLRFVAQGNGNDTRAIAGSLNGDLQLVMENGQISNDLLQQLTSDLGTLLGPFSAPEGSTTVRCMAARLRAENGIAKLEQMVLDTREVLLVGRGQINLRRGTLDILLLPDNRGLSLTRLQLPIRISGPLNDPDADPDPAALLQQAGGDLLNFLAGENSPLDAPLRARFSNSNQGCAASLAAYQSDGQGGKDR